MIGPHRRNQPGSVRSLQLIWGAITASVVIYGVLAFIVAGAVAAEPGTVSSANGPYTDPIVLVLHAVGLGALAAGYFIPQLILSAPY